MGAATNISASTHPSICSYWELRAPLATTRHHDVAAARHHHLLLDGYARLYPPPPPSTSTVSPSLACWRTRSEAASFAHKVISRRLPNRHCGGHITGLQRSTVTLPVYRAARPPAEEMTLSSQSPGNAIPFFLFVDKSPRGCFSWVRTQPVPWLNPGVLDGRVAAMRHRRRCSQTCQLNCQTCRVTAHQNQRHPTIKSPN